MVCMMCFPCSRRTGALSVGIFDLIMGSAGLSAVCFLLYIINDEISKLDDSTREIQERLHILTALYWSVMLSYVFPATVTLTTGILTVCAVVYKNDCFAIASILLSGVVMIACGGIALILYSIKIELPFLIPLIFGTAVHAFFTLVLMSFRTNDLKLGRSV